MSQVSHLSGFRIAAIVLTLSAGRALAGFTEISKAKASTPSLNQDAIASTDDDALPAVLTFDVNSTDHSVTEQQTTSKRPLADVQSTQLPVAAPLPVALLPGAVMLAASFIATRVLKRRLA